jgi:hypothetical protein
MISKHGGLAGKSAAPGTNRVLPLRVAAPHTQLPASCRGRINDLRLGKKNKGSKKNGSSNVRVDGFENTDANLWSAGNQCPNWQVAA